MVNIAILKEAYRKEIADRIYPECKQWEQTDVLLSILNGRTQAEEYRHLTKFKIRSTVLKIYCEFRQAHRLNNDTMAEIHQAWCLSVAKQGTSLDRKAKEINRVFRFWNQVASMAQGVRA